MQSANDVRQFHADAPARFDRTGQDRPDDRRPTKELDHEDLFDRLSTWWQDDRDHCEAWHKVAREEFGFAALDQWSHEDQEVMDEQNRPTVIFDRIGPVIASVTGSEVANRQEVRYIPRQVSDAAVNEVFSEAARWFRDECDAEHEESQAFTDCVIVGMGWTDTRLDYETNPDGDPVIERIDPLEMYWDGAATRANLVDARRIWRIRRDVPIEEARALFPDADDEDLHAGWCAVGAGGGKDDPIDVTSPRYRHDKGGGRDEEAPDLITLAQVQWFERETYYRGTLRDPMTGMIEETDLTEDEHLIMLKRAAPMGRMYRAVKQVRKVYYNAFVGGVVLEAGPSRCETSFSFVPITGTLDRNKRHFYGLLRAMKDPQSFANKWLAQALHIMNTSAKGGIMSEESAFADTLEAEKSWARNDRITWLKPGGAAKISPKPTGGFPPQLMQMAEFAISSIRDATGVNAEVLGLRGVDQAASLEYQRKQAATTILAPLFDGLRRYRKIEGRILLHLITEFLSDGRLIRISGEEGEKYVPLVRDAEVVRYDVIVDDAPNSPNQKEHVWAALGQMLPFLKSLDVPTDVYLAMLDYSPFPASLVAKIKAAVAPKPEEAPGAGGPGDEQARREQMAGMLQEAMATAKLREMEAKADKAQGEAEHRRAQVGKTMQEAQQVAVETQMMALAPQRRYFQQ